MQKGVIEQKEEREAKNGSKYLTLVIGGDQYSVWAGKLFNQCEVGNIVNFEFETKDKFKNITAIVADGQQELPPGNSVRPTENNKEVSMRRMNALNNTIPMMTILNGAGHLDGKNPKEIMEIEAKLLSLHEAYLTQGKLPDIEEAKDLI